MPSQTIVDIVVSPRPAAWEAPLRLSYRQKSGVTRSMPTGSTQSDLVALISLRLRRLDQPQSPDQIVPIVWGTAERQRRSRRLQKKPYHGGSIKIDPPATFHALQIGRIVPEALQGAHSTALHGQGPADSGRFRFCDQSGGIERRPDTCRAKKHATNLTKVCGVNARTVHMCNFNY